MVFPHGSPPLRAVFLGAMTSAWYSANDDERRQRILPRFKQLVEEWKEIGAKVLATMDDDLLHKNGRSHNSEWVYRALEWARKYEFPVINLDLMSGILDETTPGSGPLSAQTVSRCPSRICMSQPPMGWT